MTEKQFRKKYPGSTDEQVRLYCEAVKAEKLQAKPAVEPDIPMPLITVPQRPAQPRPPPRAVTTYAVPRQFYTRNFSLDDVPPEVPSASLAGELRDILLGTYGFSSGLSPEQRQRLATTDMSENDILAMVIGAPSAAEFQSLLGSA
jgi:hypothetical protein